MRIHFTCCLLFNIFTSSGQFAVIRDKDSVCNVRSSADLGNNIIDKLENGHLVYGFPSSTNWTDIDYSKNNKDLNGLVYKDRLAFVSSYYEIPILTCTDSKII